MVRSLAIVLMALLLGAGVAFAAAQPDMTIVPGERIGAVALGMSEAELTQAAGPPDQRMMQGRDLLFTWGLLTARISGGAPGVDEIVVNDPRFATPERIHVGSTENAVTVTFGQPMRRSNSAGVQTLDYAGMSVLQRNGMVMQIRVRK